MQRLATGLVLTLGLIASLFLLPSEAWLGLLVLVGLLCANELATLLRSRNPGSPRWLLPTVTLMTMATMLYAGTLEGAERVAVQGLLALVVIVLPAVGALLTGEPERAWPAVPWTSFGALYCAVPVVLLFRVHESAGPWVVLLMFAVVGVGDSAAYYFGKQFGKAKLAPALSPKKTWVGSGSAVVAALVVGAVWSWFRLERIDPWLLLLVAMTQIAGQFGDLLESAIKRTSGVKDSGSILPGHGGILDRADASLLASPVFVVGVQLLGSNWR